MSNEMSDTRVPFFIFFSNGKKPVVRQLLFSNFAARQEIN